MGVRKHKTEAIVANTKAVQIRQNEGFLAKIRDFNFPLDPTLTKFEDHWAARLAAARDGGKLENTAQVQQAYVKALKEVGAAIFERYNTLAVEKVTKGLIKSKDDFQFSWQQDNSIGKYASYLDLINGIERGDFARYFSNPSPHEMIRKLNKSVEAALKSATTFRNDQLTKDAYAAKDRLLAKAFKGEAISEEDVEYVAEVYRKAGKTLSPTTWSTLLNIHTKPTPRDDAVYNGFMKIYYDELRKSEDGVIPNLGWLRKQLEIWETDQNPMKRALHGKHAQKILELLRKEQSGQNKEVNKSAQDVLKRINDEFGFGKFEAGITLDSGEYVAWKTLNDSLGLDISQYVTEFVRSRYNEAKAAGQHFNQSKVAQEVMDLITQGINKRGLSAAHLRIPEDQLRGAYTRKAADLLHKTKTATAYDDLLIELAKVRLSRITRMLNNDTLSIDDAVKPKHYRDWVNWLRKQTPARQEKALGTVGKINWWRQLEFAPIGTNIKELQLETGYDAAITGYQWGSSRGEESADVEKPDATTQDTTTDDGAGSPALPEKEMPPKVKEETEERKVEMEAGAGAGEEETITEESTTKFSPPDLSTEVGSDKFPALTNKVLGQTADGRNIYANERDSEGYDSESSERAFHFQHTDGKWYSYPTIFNGKEISPAEAYKLFVENGGVDPESGVVSPAFDDEQGVLDYMTERSEHLSDHLHPAKQVQKLREEGSPYEAVVSALSSLYEGSDIQKANLTLKVVRDALTNIVKGAASEGLSATWSTIKGLYDKYDGSIDRMADGLAGYLQKKLEHRERGEGEYEPEGSDEEAFEEVIAQLEAGGAGGGGGEEPVEESPPIEEPTLGGEEEPAVFDPEGPEFDYEGAKAAGLTPDASGHWSSRDPKTGLLFKGHGHETWHKTVAAEEEMGNTIIKGEDGRYYSINPVDALVEDFPELTGIKDAWDRVPDEFRSEVSKSVTRYVHEHGVIGDGQDIIDIINKVTAEGGGSLSKPDEKAADDIFKDARAKFTVNGKLDEKAYVVALEEILDKAVENSIKTGNNNPALAIIRELNKYRGE